MYAIRPRPAVVAVSSLGPEIAFEVAEKNVCELLRAPAREAHDRELKESVRT